MKDKFLEFLFLLFPVVCVAFAPLPQAAFAAGEPVRLVVTKAAHDFGDGKGPVKGAYGPWFIRLSTPTWKGIGIHGTHDPGSIGTAATEGCIRLKNPDIIRLVGRIAVGTRVTIRP